MEITNKDSNLRQEIERAIRTTLVVLNKQSISIAVDKIMKEINNDKTIERK